MGEGPDAEGSVNTEGCTDVKSTERYIVGKRRRYNGKQRAKVEEIKKKMHSEQILKELFAEIGDNTVVGGHRKRLEKPSNGWKRKRSDSEVFLLFALRLSTQKADEK